MPISRRATEAEEAAWWERRGRFLGLKKLADSYRYDQRVIKGLLSSSPGCGACLNCGYYWEGHSGARCIYDGDKYKISGPALYAYLSVKRWL